MPKKPASSEMEQRIRTLEQELLETRQTAEEACRSGETKYRTLFKNFPEEIHVWEVERNKAGKITTWRLAEANPAALAVWDKKLEEVRGKTADDIWGPGTTDHFRPVIQKLLAEGRPHTFEDYFAPLGRHFRYTGVPFGEGFISIGVDITDKKRAEERLGRNREAITAVLDMTSACVAVFDKEGRITRFNKTCESLTGYTALEVLGRVFWEFLIPSQDLPGVMETWQALQSGNFPRHHENRWVGKHGSQNFIAWTNTVLAGPKGEIRSIVSTGIDITRRKQVEEALRENEEKYRTLFTSLSDALFLVDRETMAILEVNEAATTLFGYPREEMLALKTTDLSAHPEETERDMINFQSGIFTRFLKSRNGRVFPADIRANGFLIKDRQVIIATIRDVTERRRIEAYQNLSTEVLKILNRPEAFHTSLYRLVATVQKFTECRAVGMRLQKGEDFPYIYQSGFPEKFLAHENSLISRKASGELSRGADGNLILECTCGLVLSGKTDPDDPLFTSGGSFWTNDAERDLKFPGGADPRLFPRDRCLQQGYASIAIVPIREGEKIVGLLQLNDRRKDMFTLELIKSLEGTASHIGEAMLRKQAEQSLKDRTRELEELTNTLELRVKKRTAELEKANTKLRVVSSRLLSAQEDERRRIAVDLHDSLASILVGLKFKLEQELSHLPAEAIPALTSLEKLIPMIQEGIDECRRIQMDLRPPMLDSLGLLSTLSWLFRTLQATYPKIELSQEMAVEEVDIPLSLKTVIFRVVQEGMNNVAKHSRADRVLLGLDKVRNRLRLTIQDNGKGFDRKELYASSNDRLGFGLANIQERVALSGGSFTIHSRPGKGTVVRAHWPLGRDNP
jgi:PAS domain S-box-containing protein